jgi:hypothetical protein
VQRIFDHFLLKVGHFWHVSSAPKISDWHLLMCKLTTSIAVILSQGLGFKVTTQYKVYLRSIVTDNSCPK